MAFLAQQPNGLYTRFSTITDCPTKWNMSREDIKFLYSGLRIEPFDNVIKYYIPNNMSEKAFNRFLMETSE